MYNYNNRIVRMKSIAQLKEQIYDEVVESGQFRGMQAQLKAQVYQLIQREYGKSKIGFQYQHPQLSKLKKYPLTAYCLDLIQEFLQSFKFKHTLNVFRKEINRSVAINRSHLAHSFRIQIKNPDSQAVLLSMVQQMVSGDVGALRAQPKINNFVDTAKTAERTNNFMSESKPSDKKSQAQQKAPEPSFKKQPQNQSSSNISSSFDSSSNQNSASTPKNDSRDVSQPVNTSSSKEEPPKVEQPPKVQEEKKKGGKEAKKKPVVQKQKPPEGAKDLLGDVMKKFEPAIKAKDKQKQRNELFEAKRAFSEEKEKKALDQAESGANKIRGVSMGKTMPSFMNKFIQQQPAKNQSYIDEQLDEFQQSKDSTRKNPLFSSSQSGFDKSGFDHSVDSNAIQDYEYVQRAKRLSKKL